MLISLNVVNKCIISCPQRLSYSDFDGGCLTVGRIWKYIGNVGKVQIVVKCAAMYSDQGTAPRKTNNLAKQSTTRNIEPCTAMQLNIIKKETVLKSEAWDDVHQGSSNMDWNSKSDLSGGEIHYSETEHFAINEELKCEKSLYHFETEVKQKSETFYLPELVKVESADENQPGLSAISNFREVNATEFYIKTEEIKIKTEDDVMGNIMDSNSKAELSKGQIHYSDTEQFGINGDENCDKSLYHFETEVKQEKEKLYLPEITKMENTDENQSDLAEFYIKTEDIEIKSEDDVMGDDYEVVAGKVTSQNMKSCQLSTVNTSSEKLFDNHLLSHNNLQDGKLFSCIHCPYKAKRKDRLKAHLLKHKDKSELVTFNCDQCPFRGKEKSSLKRHLLIHKDKSELVTFNCDQCLYMGKEKTALRRHLLTHKDKSELVTFNCEQCSYKAKTKEVLKRHLLVHKDKSQIVTYNCAHCPYKTKWKNTLKRHLLFHKDKSEIVTVNCDQCPYKGKDKAALRIHLLSHKDKSELVTFNCDQCPYKAKRKLCLNRHIMLMHKIPQELELFGCPDCPFTTKSKITLKRHQLTHNNIKNKDVLL